MAFSYFFAFRYPIPLFITTTFLPKELQIFPILTNNRWNKGFLSYLIINNKNPLYVVHSEVCNYYGQEIYRNSPPTLGAYMVLKFSEVKLLLGSRTTLMSILHFQVTDFDAVFPLLRYYISTFGTISCNI